MVGASAEGITVVGAVNVESVNVESITRESTGLSLLAMLRQVYTASARARKVALAQLARSYRPKLQRHGQARGHANLHANRHANFTPKAAALMDLFRSKVQIPNAVALTNYARNSN